MASANDSALDDALLLQAEFDEKDSGAFDTSMSRRLEVLRKMFSLRAAMVAFKPSFLDRNSKPGKIHPTAWLDGIRGFASFFVFVYHFQHLFHNAYVSGYASKNGDNDRWLIQLPIIRLMFAGGPMVDIFWVLSGISLALNPIKLARNHYWDTFFETLFSSVFRRGLRLYLPVFFVQCCVLLAACLGLYNHADALANEWPFNGANEMQFKVFDTNTEQVQDWLKEMWHFANPFKPLRPKYDSHLWTIPLEFNNSILLFAALIGLAKLRPRIRMILTWALYAFCVMVEEPSLGLFIAGMGLAEYLVVREEKTQNLPTAQGSVKPQTWRIKALWMVVLYAGLHLLSWPMYNFETTPGYMTLHETFKPYFHSTLATFCPIGAAVTLLAVCGCDWLRKPFQTPFAVYLGKISFPLYIVHGPIIHIMGTGLVQFFWRFTGNETMLSYECGVFASFLCCTAVAFWLADLLMRKIDAPSVKFGRTLQNRWSC